MKKKKRRASNPVAKYMSQGEHGWKASKRVHRKKEKPTPEPIVPQEYEAWFDGAFNRHTGCAGWGFLVKRGGIKVHEAFGGDNFDEHSTNTAEYMGLNNLLSWLEKNEIDDVDIYGDSKMVIKQSRGEYKVGEGGLYEPFYREAQSLLSNFTGLRFFWNPREQNMEADALSKRGIAECQTGG